MAGKTAESGGAHLSMDSLAKGPDPNKTPKLAQWYAYPDEPEIVCPIPHNCRRYEGKVCLTTASTLGIGLAIATRMAEEGGKVVVSSRKQEQVDAVVKDLTSKGYECIGAVCHQATTEHRKNLIDMTMKKWGKIDVVVLGAGVQPAPATKMNTLEVADDVFDKVMEVNVKSFFQFTKEVWPYVTKPGGAFCFISSNGGFAPAPPLGIYGVSKLAVVGLAKLFAGELGTHGVRFNTIAPGVTRTRFAEILWKPSKDGKIAPARLGTENMAYLHRVAEPWEQASVVAFLCSHDAHYITGENMITGGGGGLDARI